MAALERFFLQNGCKVGGYDLTPSHLTAQLQAEGVVMDHTGLACNIPDEFRNPDTTLVVYTPAVPQQLDTLVWFRTQGFEIVKRAELLGLLTRDTSGLCFAGTHGKTTSSSIAAHIMNLTPGLGCNAFLGGILRNYGSNLILSEHSPYTVIEADEYDRSFHRLSPYVAVVTSTDPDHLDIYGDEAGYLDGFSQFTSLIKPNGFLLMHTGLKLRPAVKPGVKIYTYSSDGTPADFMALNIRRHGNHLLFDAQLPDNTVMKDLELGLPVKVNVDNSMAAIGAVWLTGKLQEAPLREALKTFKGSERRFELRWEENKPGGRVIIDDYAHHPREIEASIESVKQMFPGREVTVTFQPHLYSRTRDFAPQFAKALESAHRVMLVDLYPARELPIEGIDSYTILNLIANEKKEFVSKENFAKHVKNSNFDILLTLGAGDLPNFIPGLIELLEK